MRARRSDRVPTQLTRGARDAALHCVTPLRKRKTMAIAAPRSAEANRQPQVGLERAQGGSARGPQAEAKRRAAKRRAAQRREQPASQKQTLLRLRVRDQHDRVVKTPLNNDDSLVTAREGLNAGRVVQYT